VDIVSQEKINFAGIIRKKKHFLQVASLQVMLGEIEILGENSDNHFDRFSSLCSPKKDSKFLERKKKVHNCHISMKKSNWHTLECSVK
jgi:hypothetical protein